MNKLELVKVVAEKANTTLKVAEEVINATIESIKEAVKNGEEVSLVGFGTFSKAEKKATECRNPQTGAKIAVPAKLVAKFKVSKKFLD